ncbi:MAG: hypothetical protein WBK76_00595 [Candidatus Saccharimonadales bacterium]
MAVEIRSLDHTLDSDSRAALMCQGILHSLNRIIISTPNSISLTLLRDQIIPTGELYIILAHNNIDDLDLEGNDDIITGSHGRYKIAKHYIITYMTPTLAMFNEAVTFWQEENNKVTMEHKTKKQKTKTEESVCKTMLKRIVLDLDNREIELQTTKSIMEVELQGYRHAIAKLEKAISMTNQQVEQIQGCRQNSNNQEEYVQRIIDSAQQLIDNDLYESITFNMQNIKATTAPIFITDKYIYAMGQYDITISYEGTMSVLLNTKTENTRVSHNRNMHPHVNSSGNICAGNIGPRLNKYALRGEYTTVLLVLHEFLSTWSSKNPYINIADGWEQCTEDKKTSILENWKRNKT